ncbi:MAG: GNAT family N-acetyltransferase [Geodermatophilaceae bacterium]|nr:GNAT family N-acetyltransferase [Geodermatophilaceae bacterium]
MADASVRPARAADAAEIARVQLSTWRTAYGGHLPVDVLAATDQDRAGQLWRTAIEAPPGPGYHVFVAVEGDTLVGFAGLEPDDERADAGLVTTLLVQPRWGRRGHGSRLLAAVVDHARADRRTALQAWVLERDTASVGFYESAGWARDGWVRTLEPDGTAIREIRLHTTLGPTAIDGEPT